MPFIHKKTGITNIIFNLGDQIKQFFFTLISITKISMFVKKNFRITLFVFSMETPCLLTRAISSLFARENASGLLLAQGWFSTNCIINFAEWYINMGVHVCIYVCVYVCACGCVFFLHSSLSYILLILSRNQNMSHICEPFAVSNIHLIS